MKCLCFVFKSACSSWIKNSGTRCSIRNHNILKQRDKLENLQTQIQFIQGCGIRTFPIGGILDAPSQVTGSPTSTAVINNAVFVSKLIRLVFLNLLLDCSIQFFYIICTIHLFFKSIAHLCFAQGRSSIDCVSQNQFTMIYDQFLRASSVHSSVPYSLAEGVQNEHLKNRKN